MTPGEVLDALIDEAVRLSGLSYNSGFEAGKAKSRLIATDDGLIDGADFARQYVRKTLEKRRAASLADQAGER